MFLSEILGAVRKQKAPRHTTVSTIEGGAQSPATLIREVDETILPAGMDVF
jgi:hypothetical protein